MANPEHLEILKQGVEVWNWWRETNPKIKPDLEAAELAGTDLRLANLENAYLWGADLARANLAGSKLGYAYLVGAHLEETRLHTADLSGAILRRAALQGADVSKADFGWTALVDLNLSNMIGLAQANHIGPSGISTSTLELTATGLSHAMHRRAEIESFLRGAGVAEGYIDFFRSWSAQPIQFYSSFISYSHQDNSFARSLHDQLQARGIRCWLDEHDLKPGDRILDVVNDAIRLHDKILLCCSETSLESWWVKDEIRKAQERERRDGRDIIIPLMVDRYLLDGWEDGLAADLRSRLAADFTGWEHDNAEFEGQLERVIKALRANEAAQERAPE